MLEIREFRPEDAVDVSRIMADSFRTFLGHRMDGEKPLPPEYYANGGHVRSPRYHGQAFTALEDGKVIGYINVSADLETKLGTLGVIGVDPNSMAHGAGTALFKAAYGFWMERGMEKIYTCTSSINTRAQRYYAKMGFVEEGRRRRHFFSDVDEISLVIYPKRKELDAPLVDVRPLEEADVDAVAAFLAAEGMDGGPERVRSWLTPPDDLLSRHALVARCKADGAVAGAVFCSCIARYNLASLSMIHVGTACRGKGVGTALEHALAQRLKECFPVRKIDCTLSMKQVDCLPFLLHRGFVLEEALRNQDGQGTAVLRLGKFFDE